MAKLPVGLDRHVHEEIDVGTMSRLRMPYLRDFEHEILAAGMLIFAC